MVLRALLVLAMLWPVSAAGQTRSGDPAAAFIEQLEQAAATGSVDAVMALGATPEASGVRMFAALAVPKPTRFIIKERDRAALEPEGEVLLLEVFGEYGNQATITTWRAELVPLAGDGNARRITEIEELTTVSGLYKLGLNPAKQFELRNLTVQATDLKLEIPSGSAFVAETPEGPTAIVLLGRGRMTFSPSDAAERTQVRIFSGEDALATEFDAVFIRVRPGEVDDVLPAAALKPVPVAAGDFRRASDFFDDSIGQTFNLDLRDLSRDRWSLIPTIGDLLAEVRTRRLGTLTYARSTKDAEDISLFDRRRRRNIAVYASAQKLASRGRFYGEDELVDYDVLRQDVEVAFSPDRMWIEGTATLEIRVRTFALATLTLRLAESLAVRSVMAGDYGRLLHLRVVGQNSVLVNLPATVQRNGIIRFTVVYGGRLEPQQIEREGIVLDQQSNTQQEEVYIPIEPQYVYSNRSYWYPQNTVTDYAISRLRVRSRRISTSWRAASRARRPRRRRAGAARTTPPQAVRLRGGAAAALSRLCVQPVHEGDDARPADRRRERSGGREAGEATSRPTRGKPRGRARLADRAAAHLRVLRVLDRRRALSRLHAGGHRERSAGRPQSGVFRHPQSAAAAVADRRGATIRSRSTGYPPYFLAHEIAHQWWGQAVGWKNYHEQWMSEGSPSTSPRSTPSRSAATGLPAACCGRCAAGRSSSRRRARSISATGSATSRLTDACSAPSSTTRARWCCTCCGDWSATRSSSRAPASSTRLGSARPAPTTSAWRWRRRAARSCGVLRRLGLRRRASRRSRSLDVSGSEARIGSSTAAPSCRRPVTVTITYADGTSEESMVAVTERVVERTIELRGAVRSIEANHDYSAVAEIER